MTDAPERIWVWPDYNDHFNPVKQDWTHGFWDGTEDPLGTEYVRADHIKAQAAEIERLRADLAKTLESLQCLLWAWNELCRAVPVLFHEPNADAARATLAEIKGESHE